MSDHEMQYAKLGGVLIPVGATQPRLTAGFYELGSANHQYGFAPSKPVSDDLIDIAGTPADDVNEDIKKFLATKGRYQKAGLTHKRGYLFYGPPGTGKTSLGLMIARRFIKDADGVVIHIPNSAHLSILTDALRKVEPGRPSMFLMEEADNFVNDVTALSILDGEQSLAGAVFVAMTNYKSKMPPRIANRPGRFDRVVYIGAPPYAVQVEYFKRLLARLEEDPATATVIADGIKDVDCSMGHLREAFISHVLMGVKMEEIRKRFIEMADGLGKDESPTGESEDAPYGTCESCGCDLDSDGTCSDEDCDCDD